MKQFAWRGLGLFGSELGGGDEVLSAVTPQTKETGEILEASAPDAGETTARKTREQEFRARMEGEYKDLFTAYFQETFNRRFREQRSRIEELERAHAVVEAAAERYGTQDVAELLTIIRAEKNTASTEMETASTSATMPQDGAQSTSLDAEFEQRLRAAVREAEARVRAETVREVLDSIRARGLRPTEGALSKRSGHALGAARLSRAQRAEMARRAARGEHIEF
ncbi:MAG: hypothetical protein IJA78_06775 [Clostridia bacterium]|nr:hypothetical protein [Clostridia bacterium]